MLAVKSAYLKNNPVDRRDQNTFSDPGDLFVHVACGDVNLAGFLGHKLCIRGFHQRFVDLLRIAFQGGNVQLRSAHDVHLTQYNPAGQ